MDEGGEKIVVGVDGSESSRQALRWAARHAKLSGASLEVVTCWETPPNYRWDVSAHFDPGGDAEHSLQATVAEVLGEDPGITIKLTVVEGHPVPVLLDAAQGAPLLVVGSRGHGAFTGMLLGSVSHHCVGHAPCPVTVVRDVDDHDGGDPG
jgi:nucleotide-binding universal stress UspA family protein